MIGDRAVTEQAARGAAGRKYGQWLTGLPPRAACLMIERPTRRGEERITTVRQIFAPGTCDLVARFGRRHHD